MAKKQIQKDGGGNPNQGPRGERVTPNKGGNGGRSINESTDRGRPIGITDTLKPPRPTK
jgi:hypothetical protein